MTVREGSTSSVDIDPKDQIKIGQNIEITYYFRTQHQVGRDLMIFLHGETTNKARVVVENLFPDPKAKQGTSQWSEGKIMMVKHFFRLPPQAEGHQVKLFAGLFIGSDRLTVVGRPGQNDGKDRARIATISTSGSKAPPRRRKRRTTKQNYRQSLSLGSPPPVLPTDD